MPDLPIDGLDQPCGTCDRPTGDHTLREFAACMGKLADHLPYAEVPEDMAKIVSERVRQQFNLDPDTIIADTIVVRAGVLDGGAGTMTIRTPVVIHEFQVGRPDGPPVTVAKVMFFGTPESIRKYGILVRDSANGAVNAATGGRGR